MNTERRVKQTVHEFEARPIRPGHGRNPERGF
jgi:hypothetical protein